MNHIAVVYTRFSPRPGAQTCDSNRLQFQRCRGYCKMNHYRIIGVHWDRELSGSRADNRPGLQRAIFQACKCKAVLAVAKLDRMARNTRHALDITERLHKAKADFASTAECIDTRTPMGKMVFVLLAAFAEMERSMIVERTSDAMLRHQQNGRRMTRADCCPYGWKCDPADPARLVEVAQEQAAIAIIRAERKAGRSLRAIARGLATAGLPSRGKQWSPSTILAILNRQGEAASRPLASGPR